MNTSFSFKTLFTNWVFFSPIQLTVYQPPTPLFLYSTNTRPHINNSQENAGVQSQGILEHFYGQHFCNCVNTTVDANKSASASIKPNEFAEAMGLKIHAEPNPATNWVAFDYELPIGNDRAQLIIRNTTGKQIALFQISDKLGQKVWDTRSLKPGAYFYEFISGELKQTGKIVIIK